MMRCLNLLLPLCAAWEPNWESLDSRPLPSWYDEAKFGVFVHWGVFSVPAFGSEWFWMKWALGQKEYVDYVQATERPGFSYPDYAHRFLANLYDPNTWTKLFSQSGAQYVVMTSKHHEGFCNWDSKNIPSTWNWNAMDLGPRRDILGDMAEAVKQTRSITTGKKLRWGIYHSLLEWFNPAYLADKDSGFQTTAFRDTKAIPELYDLVNRYEPELIWSDGAWEAPDTYWNGQEFLAWYATNSTVADSCVWNDRWGAKTPRHHGAFWTHSGRKYDPHELLENKWENSLKVDGTSWGLNRNASIKSYAPVEFFVHRLIKVVAFGGNMLLDVGPASDGTIHPIFWDRLLGIGSWLQVNGPAIYGTKPWTFCQNETNVRTFYTRKNDALYALVMKWPTNNVLRLAAPQPTSATTVRMLGHGGTIHHERLHPQTGGMVIHMPALTPDIIPCQHAWVFAISGVQNLDRAKVNVADADDIAQKD